MGFLPQGGREVVQRALACLLLRVFKDSVRSYFMSLEHLEEHTATRFVQVLQIAVASPLGGCSL